MKKYRAGHQRTSPTPTGRYYYQQIHTEDKSHTYRQILLSTDTHRGQVPHLQADITINRHTHTDDKSHTYRQILLSTENKSHTYRQTLLSTDTHRGQVPHLRADITINRHTQKTYAQRTTGRQYDESMELALERGDQEG